jgi:hypothetical protein
LPKTSLEKENLLKSKPNEKVLGSKPSPITKKRRATKMGGKYGLRIGPNNKGRICPSHRNIPTCFKKNPSRPIKQL